jgi:hypothetical protein
MLFPTVLLNSCRLFIRRFYIFPSPLAEKYSLLTYLKSFQRSQSCFTSNIANYSSTSILFCLFCCLHTVHTVHTVLFTSMPTVQEQKHNMHFSRGLILTSTQQTCISFFYNREERILKRNV